jgi:Ca2+-binding EF-hand superfamily protein
LKYDANHDGTLTKAELIAGVKAEFDSYDTQHKGCLTDDQVAEINAARIAADQATATPLQDWNQDGCLDLREFSVAAYSLFDELDKNSDGKIAPEEFDPSKKPGARPPGTPGGAPGGGGQGGGRRRGGGGGPPQ